MKLNIKSVFVHWSEKSGSRSPNFVSRWKGLINDYKPYGISNVCRIELHVQAKKKNSQRKWQMGGQSISMQDASGLSGEGYINLILFKKQILHATFFTNYIVVAFRGKHVSPAKHSYAWLPRKCDYRKNKHTDRQTDGRTDRRRTKWSLCAAMLRRRHNNLMFSGKIKHTNQFGLFIEESIKLFSKAMGCLPCATK